MKITDVNMNAVAMNGIDPVALKNGESLSGKPELSYTLIGGKFLFSNRKNLELFSSNPKKYLPKSGIHLIEKNINQPSEDNHSAGRKTFLDREDAINTPISIKKTF